MPPAAQALDTDLVSATSRGISQMIRARELGPGDALPSETALSREMKVSRTVVREAFRGLAALRLIDLRAGRRATVAALDYGAMSPLIEHGVHIDQISIQQIYDVRRTIETRTATLAALRRTDTQARDIRGYAVAMQAAIETPQIVLDHDIAFHVAIAQAAGNPVFSLIVGAFDGVTRQTWPIGWRSRTDIEDQRHMLTLHLAIADAIVAGDPQAAHARMADHFDQSVKALVAAGIS